MEQKPLLIHTHFHNRRTGLTRSVENVFPLFDSEFESYIHGYGIEGRKISVKKMLQLVFSKKYFVMHCHRNNEIMRALFYRFLGGNFKLISTRHAESAPSGLTKFLLQKSDVIISLTKSMQTALEFPTTVVGHGVDVSSFKPNKLEKRKEISQKNILTCAGRVRKAKGQVFLLETVAPLLKKNPDWALAIVGKIEKPEFEESLKKIVADNEVASQVYFIDETPEIISFYQASHSVIVPSYTEGFSLVCAEAMACGCNVLATRNVGVHSDIISESKTGYLFEPGNQQELSGLIAMLFENELPHLGENAQKEINTNWSAEVEANNLMVIYKTK
jgi:mannosyltransferase